MRVTLIINRFPPHHGGGYGLRFGDLAAGLHERGHRVSVVTSTVGVDGPRVEPEGVHRVLTRFGEVHGWRGVAKLAATTWRDGRRLRRALRAERPDVILVGNFFGLSSGLWTVLREASAPLVLDVSNEWLLDVAGSHGNWFRIWEKPSRSRLGATAKGIARGLLALAPGGLLRTRFPGLGARRIYATAPHLIEQLRREGVTGDVPLAVCPSGIALDDFAYRPADRPVRRLLYVGRLKAVKGVHTAVEALEALPGDHELTILGIPDDEAYATEIEARAAALGDRVALREPVPRKDLPGVFAQHDVLVFPTVYAEAFSRLILEAMACGLPVVATPTGGTPEAVEHGVTGLSFPPEDATALAAAVRRLGEDDALRRGLIAAGRRLVEERYELGAAVRRIEALLLETVREGARSGQVA